MRKFLKEYNNPEEGRINYKLINREYDGDLVNYIIDSCKSLEVLENIEFIGYKVVTNEADINTSQYIDQKARGKKENKAIKYMYMHDNRNAELVLRFKLTCKGEEKIIQKNILIPIPDEDGYYTVKGNRYFLLWQIVDNSTLKLLGSSYSNI